VAQKRDPIQLVVDLAERLFLILLAIPFLWAFAKSLPTHPTIILLCASEMLGVVLIIIRKPAAVRVHAVAILAAFCGTALPLLVRPGGTPLVPVIASTVCMTAGLVLTVASKVYLNRSFGLIAANRGVKSGGPYRFVRHPMYLGYFVSQLGFLAANLSAANVLVYIAAWSFQLLRIAEEESVLRLDESYVRFTHRVRNRVIPGVY
jgi:protein-S-isoprenylcysteine O-methyltransferase Ste14